MGEAQVPPNFLCLRPATDSEVLFSLRVKMRGKNLLAIMGPTAVGKTGVAVRLADHFSAEVISADSRQIFSEMEIGTAKPTQDELFRTKHHFINHRSIQDEYDAGTFAKEGGEVIDQLLEKNSTAILCGGSGLYIKAILEGFDDLPDVPAGIRDQITKEYRDKGLAWLQQQIFEHDPSYFEVVDRQNSQRLMRALEICRSTGKPFSEYHKKEKKVLPFTVIKIGLELERKELYDRIDRRMDEMIGQGLFAEAEKFFPLRHLNALQTVGYQEIFDFMEGAYDRGEAIRLMKRNTRHYAKRQLTWFKKDKEIQWFHPQDWDGILGFIKERTSE